jgi:hypothetical protein
MMSPVVLSFLLITSFYLATAQDVEVELGKYYNNLLITTDERQR